MPGGSMAYESHIAYGTSTRLASDPGKGATQNPHTFFGGKEIKPAFSAEDVIEPAANCTSLTKAGNQCQKSPQEGSDLCVIHGG